MILSHDISGTGPAVLLLHSSVCDRRMWDPQLDDLIAAGYRVLRADFRGYGETPPPTGSFNPADDVRDLLDHLGLGEVAIVGSSYGGRIASEVAARWPDRVGTLVLICAGQAGAEPTPAAIAFGDHEDELLEAGDLDAAVQLNLDTWVGPRADDATRAFVGDMQRHNFHVQLAAPDVAPAPVAYDLATVAARTLVVSGGHDLDLFQQVAVSLAGIIPAARHEHLDWAGHLPSLEDPASFNPIMLDFLVGS